MSTTRCEAKNIPPHDKWGAGNDGRGAGNDAFVGAGNDAFVEPLRMEDEKWSWEEPVFPDQNAV